MISNNFQNDHCYLKLCDLCYSHPLYKKYNSCKCLVDFRLYPTFNYTLKPFISPKFTFVKEKNNSLVKIAHGLFEIYIITTVNLIWLNKAIFKITTVRNKSTRCCYIANCDNTIFNFLRRHRANTV